MAPKEILSLFQLNQQIKDVLTESFTAPIWVRAEIAEFRENRNGHCYLELIEKSDNNDQIVARAKAIIWSYTYRMLKPYFETSTGRSLNSGLKVMVQVHIEFQEVYGLSLIIRDIDPTYTLGDLEQRKREVIQRLHQEGVFDMNRELNFPTVPQHIAIISSPTAAGYGDFVNQLEHNSFGIKFYHHLFPAIMQGDQASESIAKAFDAVYEHLPFFDLVVIIRGGGATLDLLCFDDYWLAYNITQFPIPVITGIGHERDQSVADLVAHKALKTPTAVAEFLISKSVEFLERINQYADLLLEWTHSELQSRKHYLLSVVNSFSPKVHLLLQQKKFQVERIESALPLKSKRLLQSQNVKINGLASDLNRISQRKINTGLSGLIEKKKHLTLLSLTLLKHQNKQLRFYEISNRLNNPIELLKRGYTLTYSDGKLIKDGQVLTEGQCIETRFRDGRVASVIKGKR